MKRNSTEVTFSALIGMVLFVIICVMIATIGIAMVSSPNPSDSPYSAVRMCTELYSRAHNSTDSLIVDAAVVKRLSYPCYKEMERISK